MIVRSRLLLPVVAIALAFAFAVPAAFADDMSKDSMSKDTSMKKDSMSKDKMSKDHMSKDRCRRTTCPRTRCRRPHVQGQDVEGQYVEVITTAGMRRARIPRPGASRFAGCSLAEFKMTIKSRGHRSVYQRRATLSAGDRLLAGSQRLPFATEFLPRNRDR